MTTLTTPPTTCALPGCDNSVEQPVGGGRPRLYCSDSHRAAARRVRLGDAGDGGTLVSSPGAAEQNDDGAAGLARELTAAAGALARLAPAIAAALADAE